MAQTYWFDGARGVDGARALLFAGLGGEVGGQQPQRSPIMGSVASSHRTRSLQVACSAAHVALPYWLMVREASVTLALYYSLP